MLRLGDNVVWQLESMDEYLRVLQPYVKQSLSEKRTLVTSDSIYYRNLWKTKLKNMKNIVETIVGNQPINKEVICVYDSFGCQLYSDIVSQRVILL